MLLYTSMWIRSKTGRPTDDRPKATPITSDQCYIAAERYPLTIIIIFFFVFSFNSTPIPLSLSPLIVEYFISDKKV